MRFVPQTDVPAALLLFLALAHAPVSAEDAGLTPYSAEYDVKIRVLSGKLTARLSRADNRYVAVHRVMPTGLAAVLVKGTIEESSGFAVEPGGVRPLHYTSSDTISSDETQADFQFDWSTHSISGELNGTPVAMDFDGAAHDRISIQYAMMRDMLTGEAGKSYVLFDIDEFKTLHISLLGEKDIEVPAGRYRAVGVRHQAEGSSRITTLWCVPELDYLPAIIEQHRKGKLNLRAVLAQYDADEDSG